MSKRLLQGNKFQAKIICRPFLFLVLTIFLFTTCLKAQESLQVGTATREMIVYAPPTIVKDRPLVISMHGMNQVMADQKNQTQFESVAKDNNFVLVFPNAINKQWQLWGNAD